MRPPLGAGEMDEVDAEEVDDPGEEMLGCGEGIAGVLLY